MLTANELSTLMSLAYLGEVEKDTFSVDSGLGKKLVSRLHTAKAKALAKRVVGKETPSAPEKYREDVRSIRLMAGVEY